MAAFGASVGFDKRLAPYDIALSAAHAEMLARQKIIAKKDAAAISRGLRQIRGEIESGAFDWREADEDVHLNIERRLIEIIGEAGKRLRIARSRNDQVAADVRLWLRDAIDDLSAVLRGARRALLNLASRHTETAMAGMTHTQVAQPTTFAHHLLAYDAMLARDLARLADCRKRTNIMPLGACALAGTSFPLDRAFVARRLGFAALCENDADAVADRDFAAEFCAACALLMAHLSRFCEELIWWMNPAFGAVRVGDAFCTGSSVMPQKKNPDAAELIRGKCGRVFGALIAQLTIAKAQPLAYNRDNQEDKEPLFDCYDTAYACADIFAAMLKTVRVDKKRLRATAEAGFSTATELADYLARKGAPFRDAHAAAAAAVARAEADGKRLADLDLKTLRGFSGDIAADVFDALRIDGAIGSRTNPGGCAPSQTRKAIAAARAALARKKPAR